jgi:hypothetical protein
MKPNSPFSPSIYEDHADVQSHIGTEAAEQFLMSDALLRDHLRSAEHTPIDPLFTVEIMGRIAQEVPAPSRLTKLFTVTPVIGVIVFVFTIGFLFGFVAGGLPTWEDVASWMTIETLSSPYVLWSIVGISALGLGVYQMETT